MKILEILKESYDKDVEALQKELKAAGADLGPYGPERNGIDGLLGPFTRKAAAQHPDIAKKYTNTLAKKDTFDTDLSVIQDPDFNKKLDKIAKQLGVESKAIMAVIKHESGGNPAAVNRASGATGLIQFMPDTARRLGTSTGELRGMSAVDQLDYVYKYYKMTNVRPGMKAGDLYVATFMPAAMGKPDNTVLGQSGAGGFSGAVYRQNRGLDRDGNGTITIADIKNSVERFA